MSTTTMPKRHRARWSNTEINRLYNEYEIKELTVQEIAYLHERTVYAVMSKLQMEGLIDSSLNNARGWVFQSQSPKQSLSLQPALQFDQDDDAESVEQDDPDDDDYVPDDEEDDDADEDDDEDDDTEDYDQYSIKQKVTFLEKQIANIFSFLQNNLPNKKKNMNATI